MVFNAEDLSVDGVRALQPYQPGKSVKELERELGLSNIVKLASNENPRTRVTSLRRHWHNKSQIPAGTLMVLVGYLKPGFPSYSGYLQTN
jgi:hypothetical protein